MSALSIWRSAVGNKRRIANCKLQIDNYKSEATCAVCDNDGADELLSSICNSQFAIVTLQFLPALGSRQSAAGKRGAFSLIELLIVIGIDRKSTRLNSSHIQKSRMPSSA